MEGLLTDEELAAIRERLTVTEAQFVGQGPGYCLMLLRREVPKLFDHIAALAAPAPGVQTEALNERIGAIKARLARYDRKGGWADFGTATATDDIRFLLAHFPAPGVREAMEEWRLLMLMDGGGVTSNHPTYQDAENSLLAEYQLGGRIRAFSIARVDARISSLPEEK